MLLVGGRLGKDEAIGGNAILQEGCQQVGAGRDGGEAPEDAARRAGKNLRPYADHFAAELRDIVERGKDEGTFRQAMIGAAGGTRTGAGDAVVGLVAFRQAAKLFLVEGSGTVRGDDRIGNAIVEAEAGDRARIAEPCGFYRCIGECDDAEPIATGEALEIDEDIGAPVGNRPRGGSVIKIAQGNDCVLEHGRPAFLLHRAIGAGVAEEPDVETVAIMRHQHFAREDHGGVAVEVARQIGDADLLARRAEAAACGREAVDLAGDEELVEASTTVCRLVVRPHQPAMHGLRGEHVLPGRIALVHDAAQAVCLDVEIGQFQRRIKPLRIQHPVGGEICQRRLEKRQHPLDPMGTAQNGHAQHHLPRICRIKQRHKICRLIRAAGRQQGIDDGAGEA